jgi:RyR domain
MISERQVAAICHEANRRYCVALGDTSQPEWEEAPDWQKNSAIEGVKFVLDNPDAPVSASHDSWLAVKEAEGWKYGAVKDPEKKEHPCYVPYEELPEEQKMKDHLFKGVVESLRSFTHRLPDSVAATG